MMDSRMRNRDGKSWELCNWNEDVVIQSESNEDLRNPNSFLLSSFCAALSLIFGHFWSCSWMGEKMLEAKFGHALNYEWVIQFHSIDIWTLIKSVADGMQMHQLDDFRKQISHVQYLRLKLKASPLMSSACCWWWCRRKSNPNLQFSISLSDLKCNVCTNRD